MCPSKTFSLVEGLSTANPQLTGLVVHSLFMYALGVPGGSIFDELAGLIDPTPEEPTVEPKGVVVGTINDDGTYTNRPDEDIYADQLKNLVGREVDSGAANRARTLGNSISNLKAMGFELVYEGDCIAGELGLELNQPQRQASFTFGGVTYEAITIRSDDLL